MPEANVDLVKLVCAWVRLDEAAMAEVRKNHVLTQANIAISNAERVEQRMKRRAGL